MRCNYKLNGFKLGLSLPSANSFSLPLAIWQIELLLPFICIAKDETLLQCLVDNHTINKNILLEALSIYTDKEWIEGAIIIERTLAENNMLDEDTQIRFSL